MNNANGSDKHYDTTNFLSSIKHPEKKQIQVRSGNER